MVHSSFYANYTTTSAPAYFFFLMIRPPPISTLFPYTTLFRSLKVSRLKLPVIWLLVSMWLNTLTKSQIWTLKPTRSEERFSRNAETDIVCRLLLEKKKHQPVERRPFLGCNDRHVDGL